MEEPGSYVIKDDNGNVLARVYYNGRKFQVFRHPACSLGTFFHIILFLEEQGYDLQL
jgi:hypothetical protein